MHACPVVIVPCILGGGGGGGGVEVPLCVCVCACILESFLICQHFREHLILDAI